MERENCTFEVEVDLLKRALPDADRAYSSGLSESLYSFVSSVPSEKFLRASSDPAGGRVRSSPRSLSQLKRDQEELREGLRRAKQEDLQRYQRAFSLRASKTNVVTVAWEENDSDLFLSGDRRLSFGGRRPSPRSEDDFVQEEHKVASVEKAELRCASSKQPFSPTLKTKLVLMFAPRRRQQPLRKA